MKETQFQSSRNNFKIVTLKLKIARYELIMLRNELSLLRNKLCCEKKSQNSETKMNSGI